MNSRIHVVVGIIFDANKDKVLISKRTKKQHLGGYWEFPGGKIKSNEKPFLALKRELGEELGIDVKGVWGVLLIPIIHLISDLSRQKCIKIEKTSIKYLKTFCIVKKMHKNEKKDLTNLQITV